MFNFHRIYGATNDVKIHMITRSGASDSGGTFLDNNQCTIHTMDQLQLIQLQHQIATNFIK